MKMPNFNKELIIYEKGDVVKNYFTGETIELNGTELAIYDYMLEMLRIIDHYGNYNKESFPYQKELRIGLDWFRENNYKAFQTLLE